jgi:hypothetical protein
MINVPPPASGTLKIRTETGDPTVVRFDYKGIKYVMRIAHSIVAVWPTGGPPSPDGTPAFNVQLAPTITISKETGS